MNAYADHGAVAQQEEPRSAWPLGGMAYTADLKPAAARRVGSNPTGAMFKRSTHGGRSIIWLMSQTVNLVYAGSNPVDHPFALTAPAGWGTCLINRTTWVQFPMSACVGIAQRERPRAA